jgi:hypothetical protein
VLTGLSLHQAHLIRVGHVNGKTIISEIVMRYSMHVCVCVPQLNCVPLLTSSKVMVPTVDETLSATVTKLFVANLRPGVRYQCYLQARTRKGFGPPIVKEFWTEPSGTFCVF